MRNILQIVILVCAIVIKSVSATATTSSGILGVVADLHFDPLQPEAIAGDLNSTPVDEWFGLFATAGEQPASRPGRETGPLLLSSALSAIAERMVPADLVIVAGDLLSHRFGAVASPGAPSNTKPEAHHGLEEKTAVFVIRALSQLLPGKPVVVALGNNDSDCGDYGIEPGGKFLAATMDTVRSAIGKNHLTEDFERTYLAGGYYEVLHPKVVNTSILVLNDVLWSKSYQNRCGTTGMQEASNQLRWLKSRLEAQQARRGSVWLVHHTPLGVDAYATLHSKADVCASGIIPYMRDDVSKDLIALLSQHAGIIAASFSAHSHYDDFRLLRDRNGRPAAVEKMVPAISPVFGQLPSFQVFTYDTVHGSLLDYTSYSLINLEALSSSEGETAGDWREQYVFSQIYDEDGYSPASISDLAKALDRPGKVREFYYDRRTRPSGAEDHRAYSCAISHVDREGFARCFCEPYP